MGFRVITRMEVVNEDGEVVDVHGHTAYAYKNNRNFRGLNAVRDSRDFDTVIEALARMNEMFKINTTVGGL